MKLNGKYWIYLEPYVYVNVKNKSFIIYNTLDHSYVCDTDSQFSEILKSLIDPINCGVVLFDCIGGDSDRSLLFIEGLMSKFMCDIIPVELSLVKPVQPLPMPHIRRDYIKDKYSYEGVNVLRYLSELSVYMNTSCVCNCNYCNLYYRQLSFCSKLDEKCVDNSFDGLKKILKRIIGFNFKGRVNLFAGDCSIYCNERSELNDIMDPIKDQCYIYCFKDNIYHLPLSGMFYSIDKIQVLIDYPVDDRLIEFLTEYNLINITIVVKNESEYLYFDSLFGGDNRWNIDLKVFYTKDNMDFFEQYVFLDEKDIINSVSDMNNIHINELINSCFFGKMFILNNGEVYSNMNTNPVGNIMSDSMSDIIYKELISDDSYWMKTRNILECNECVYQYLCPPISNYEIALVNRTICCKK